MNSAIILETWEILSSYVPEKDKVDAAIQLLKCFQDNGLDPEDHLVSLRDEDKHLDEALDNLFPEEEIDDYEEYDIEDDY